VLANDGRVAKLEGHNALVRTDMPDGKVALLIGGGSGHEPMFHGFVGKNMGDGAACGEVFAAPFAGHHRAKRPRPCIAARACCSSTATMPATT
jgi:dihydroxyacetone kinase